MHVRGESDRPLLKGSKGGMMADLLAGESLSEGR